MLCQLSIRNIALIEDLTIEFTQGLNVLTGETGAGKSIVIDAMNLALGERADRDLIRAGQEKARVEALFDVSGCEAAVQELEGMGVDVSDGQLVVTRELSLSGRNVVRLNGNLTPLAGLKAVSALLVDVHGQHEHQSLMNEEKHLGFLDGFAQAAIAPLRQEVAERYAAWRKLAERYRRVVGGARQRAQRLDMLRFQVGEIENARLRPGEEEELRQSQSMYRNFERIAGALGGALEHLEGGQRGEGALDGLREAAAALSGASRYLPELSELEDALNEALYTAEDAASQVADQLSSMDYDEREAERVENRLDEIRRLEKKYGASVEAILQYHEEISKELESLQGDEEDASSLEKEASRAETRLLQAEEALSQARKEAARAFEKAMLVQLADLGMSKASFQVEFAPLPEGRQALSALHGPRGYDRLRFLLSANRGEPLKPLSRTASGGELSRIMLAFKTICAGEVGSMVFDEIDTGISGRMAQVVGEKMAAIGRERQVICVTHLPQIAALGDSHHLVEKFSDENRTYTRVQTLDEEGRARELARMMGGRELTTAALQNAREMLAAAKTGDG